MPGGHHGGHHGSHKHRSRSGSPKSRSRSKSPNSKKRCGSPKPKSKPPTVTQPRNPPPALGPCGLPKDMWIVAIIVACLIIVVGIVVIPMVIVRSGRSECHNKKLDLVFVVDASSSISQNEFNVMKEFINEVINKLTIGSSATNVGFVRFDQYAEHMFYLNDFDDKDYLKLKVDDVKKVRSGTNVKEAIKAMHYEQFTAEKGDRSDAPNAAIILTDGSFDSATAEAEDASDAGITMFSIGIGDDVDEKQIQSISSPPQSKNINYFIATDFEKLHLEVTDILIASVC